MARLPRLVVPSLPHHVIQQGHDRRPVFSDDVDRRRYLEILLEVARDNDLAVHSYLLMDNHVHLLASPGQAAGLSRAMQSLGRRYVAWFNKRHQRTGTLWDGRFRAAVIDSERYLLLCMRFIETRPVHSGIAAFAGDYPWSSAAHHLGQRQDPLVSDHRLFWALGNTPFERELAWRSLLVQELGEKESRKIAETVALGWACGDEEFLVWLGARTERPVAPRPRGRPPASAERRRR
ncbi:MAG TPA: transposase [Rhodocyclaceae bacterium]|nr:transposase [Rhodocyclaceae bacterium]HMZ82795.1 transposase [Rhodocyclaceae bacterium]HNA02470.1 transposase [Rhodocyclaceae bacterium]HNB78859.1 transposase [Rhodocyclaceae bacterium]HNC60917.1 transposase [Rhodocyclaceae bacterium]